MNPVVVIERLVIHVKPLVAAFYHITADPDYPFDEILIRIKGEFKHNDVAPVGRLNGNNGFVQIGNFNPVYKFVHENVVADKQGLLHGA